jgi:hypothetical protein
MLLRAKLLTLIHHERMARIFKANQLRLKRHSFMTERVKSSALVFHVLTY